LKSIGDFAINIIPSIDTIKLFSGITALNSIAELADKIYGVFKRAYNVVGDTSENLRDLAYAGKELNIPVQQLKIMENTMKLFGLNADQAVDALKSMEKFRSGAVFGEIPEDLILKAGITPMMFGKDWQENMMLLSRVYAANTNRSARESLNQIFGSGVERMLTDPARLKSYLQQATDITAKITPKDLEMAEKYQLQQAKLSIAMDNLALALTGAALPGLTNAVISLTDLMKSEGFQNFISSIGGFVSHSANIAGQVLNPPELSTKAKLYSGMPLLGFALEQFFKNLNLKENATTAKTETTEYLQNKFPLNINITNKSDGSYIDTVIENKNRATQMDNIQNTQSTTRVK
jgi:hypothetical protein